MVGGLACAAMLVATTPARASSTQEALFQDDAQLVRQTSDQAVASTLDVLRRLGVTRVKATIFWRAIAPSEESRTRPRFNASDPAAYPAVRWGPYDRLIKLATARGLAVDLNISSPVPAWATQPTPISGWVRQYRPAPGEFQQFVRAVGTRYSGTYAPPGPAPESPPATSPPASPPSGSSCTPILGLPCLHAAGRPLARAAAVPGALPRVSLWSLWNEPNGWFFLAPQYSRGGVIASAAVYRPLVDGGYRGLVASGHGGDTILIGETAPLGRPPPGGNSVSPLRFARALYCLSPSDRPLRGAAARAGGCPTSNPRRAFPAAHPALFSASGWATHPYSLRARPDVPTPDPNAVGPADAGRLTRTLRAIFRTYRRGNGPPIYYTEFGYESNPPDPSGFSPGRQAAYLNQAEYIAYRNSRVRSYAQFLLVDTRPLANVGPSHPFYWTSFQTGLVGYDGRPKPAFGAYRMPVFVPNSFSPRAAAFRVWGGIRPAAIYGSQTARVEFRSGRGGFKTVRTLRTNNPRGYFDTRVVLRRSGVLRIAWREPGTRVTQYSRRVAIRVG
ncbi:MAG: hypothetical protein QOD76_1872 [Solirubrobacteraceae bacterium]|nr:hypothetical protein [Solirubrobacteraceae bacterium]